LIATHAQDKYRIDAQVLEKAITPKTRAIVLNSPCNPTGAVYTAENLREIGAVLERHPHVFAITDDIYRRLVYGVPWASLPREVPSLAERTILIDGVSKSYAMTGWRIGFCAGPKELVKAMDTLQGQSTTNPTAIAQAAALAAITGPLDTVNAMHAEFDRRRRAMVERLRAIPNVKLVEPEGAFYCFPDFSAYFKGDDIALADFLLEKGRVAVVPGSGFFAPGFLRLSYATSMALVEEGTARIAKALSDL
jgi:aspartate aminotransferase